MIIVAFNTFDEYVNTHQQFLVSDYSDDLRAEANWSAKATTLRALLDGTSLFVLDDLVQVLTHTSGDLTGAAAGR